MKQVTAILLGAGQRGMDAYGAYAIANPDLFRIVAVAEPRPDRLASAAEKLGVPAENAVASWEELLDRPKFADAVLVCTQDTMHYRPTILALNKGYHVLCEKPMSPNKEEIIEMRDTALRTGKLLMVCHTLRYSAFFARVKELLNAGTIGQLISIQHQEGVGFWHMAHSFVRGNWRDSEQTSPMILAKCCHDMDLLRYFAESPCVSLSSFGSLTHFKAENAPAGAPARCTDGCPAAETCPYYAPRFYLEHPRAVKDGFVGVITMDHTPEGIMEALRTGPYGRCVYHCDNNVVDHQMVNLNFANGITASLSMCAFTYDCERTVTFMGTHGQITGNMEKSELTISDFAAMTERKEVIPHGTSGHSGSDEVLTAEFVRYIAEDNVGESLTNAVISAETHLMSLAAEDSRVQGGKVIEIA